MIALIGSLILVILAFSYSRFVFISLAFCVFYYGFQFEYIAHFMPLSFSRFWVGYSVYYACFLFYLIFAYVSLIYFPYKPTNRLSFEFENLVAVRIFSILSLLLCGFVVDLSSLGSSSRPAMVDFGYLVGMLLFVSAYLTTLYNARFLAICSFILLLFMSKLLFFTLVFYYIVISNKISLLKLCAVLLLLTSVFLAWGTFQDNLNYDSGSIEMNRFFTLDFFFNYVVEGATSVLNQINMQSEPDFGISALLSGVLRLLPGYLLREYSINLVPLDVTNSIVISGIESSLIHFGMFAPIFFTSLMCILLIFFNRGGVKVKFLAFSTMLFFLRSGTYSAVNNIVVILTLFFIFFILREVVRLFLYATLKSTASSISHTSKGSPYK